jgi:hypothetical protein
MKTYLKSPLLLGLALLLCAVPSMAQSGVNVTYNFTDFTSAPQAINRIILTPLQPFADYNGAILTAVPITGVTGTNGSYTYSNVIPGYTYRVELDSAYAVTIRTNGLPSGLSNTNVNARDFLGVAVTPQIFAYLYSTNGAQLADITNAVNALAVLRVNGTSTGQTIYNGSSSNQVITFAQLVPTNVVPISGTLYMTNGTHTVTVVGGNFNSVRRGWNIGFTNGIQDQYVVLEVENATNLTVWPAVSITHGGDATGLWYPNAIQFNDITPRDVGGIGNDGSYFVQGPSGSTNNSGKIFLGGGQHTMILSSQQTFDGYRFQVQTFNAQSPLEVDDLADEDSLRVLSNSVVSIKHGITNKDGGGTLTLYGPVAAPQTLTVTGLLTANGGQLLGTGQAIQWLGSGTILNLNGDSSLYNPTGSDPLSGFWNWNTTTTNQATTARLWDLANLQATDTAAVRNATNTTGVITANGYQFPTNLWSGRLFPIGTNYQIVTSSNLLFTGVANVPAGTAAASGELIALVTGGNITVTNPLSWYCNDGYTNRTGTNGNLLVMAMEVVPGVSTNFIFTQHAATGQGMGQGSGGGVGGGVTPTFNVNQFSSGSGADGTNIVSNVLLTNVNAHTFFTQTNATTGNHFDVTQGGFVATNAQTGQTIRGTNGVLTLGTGTSATITATGSSGDITASTFTGSGANLTSLPAGNLSGSINDGRLSANVALYNSTGYFSAQQSLTNQNNIIAAANITNFNLSASSISGSDANKAGISYSLAGGLSISGTSLTAVNVTNNIRHTLFSSGAIVSNSGTSETAFSTNTIPAGTLAANGNAIDYWMGITNNGTSAKTFTYNLYFGTTKIASATLTSRATAERGVLHVQVQRTGASTEYGFLALNIATAGGANPDETIGIGNAAENTANALGFSVTFTSTGSSGDINGWYEKAEFVP